jgi:hypothetical protein
LPTTQRRRAKCTIWVLSFCMTLCLFKLSVLIKNVYVYIYISCICYVWVTSFRYKLNFAFLFVFLNIITHNFEIICFTSIEYTHLIQA